jgi:VanZ family protein
LGLEIQVPVFLKGPHQTSPSVLKAWIPALIWLGFIAIESTSALSSANTGRALYPLLHFLFGVDPIRFLTWHAVLRKAGHIIGYGVLSLLLFRAWRVTIPLKRDPRWSIAWARIALTMTALVASLDEWHQSFLPSRTGTIRDVALDSAAALGAQVLLFLWLRGWRSGTPGAPANHVPHRTYAKEPTHRASTPVGD